MLKTERPLKKGCPERPMLPAGRKHVLFLALGVLVLSVDATTCTSGLCEGFNDVAPPLACHGADGQAAAVYEHMRSELKRQADRLPHLEDVAKGIGTDLKKANPGVTGVVGVLRALWWVQASVLSMVDTILTKFPLLWQEAVFEVDNLPAGAATALAVSHEPLTSQRLVCAALQSASAAPSWLCGHLTSAVPDRTVSRPCAPRRRSLWLWLAGTVGGGASCGCAQEDCTGRAVVRANPLRRPCLHHLPPEADSGVGDGSASASAAAAAAAVVGMVSTGLGVGGRAPNVETRTAVAKALLYQYRDTVPEWMGRRWIPWSFPRALVNLAMGAGLLSLAGPLSESTWVHVSLAALLGTTLAAAAVGYIMWLQGQMLLRRMPGGQLVQQLVALLMMLGLGPVAVHYDFAVLLLQWAVGGSILFWQQGAAGHEWLGKAYFCGSAVLGVLAAWRWGLFEEPAESASLLQRWMNGQANIRRAVVALGVACLLRAPSDPEAAVLLALAGCSVGTACYLAWRIHMWRNRAPEATFFRGKVQTSEEFAQEGRDYTERELAKLRTFINQNGEKVKFKGDRKNWGAIEMFSNGAPHVSAPDNSDEAGGGGWCVMQ